MDLRGLPERIEEVAANRIDPPLHIRVRIQTFPTAGPPGKGYVLVIVPPTPSKIHLVEGRYWARGRRPATPCPTPRCSATTSSC